MPQKRLWRLEVLSAIYALQLIHTVHRLFMFVINLRTDFIILGQLLTFDLILNGRELVLQLRLRL